MMEVEEMRSKRRDTRIEGEKGFERGVYVYM